jgi:uncharacterized protein (DUF433 family)
MPDSKHIECNPEILGGKPCIKGTRISVAFLRELEASGGTVETIFKAYPYLTKEAIQAALAYQP